MGPNVKIGVYSLFEGIKLSEEQELDLVDIVTFDGVGAEKFAEHAFNFADKLIREKTDNRCYVVEVECAEHGANSAIYRKP